AAPPTTYVIPAGTIMVAEAATAATAAPLSDAGAIAAGPVADVPIPRTGQPVPLASGAPGVAQTPVAHAQLAAGATVWTSTGGTPLTMLGGGIDGGAPAGGGLTVTGTGVGTGI